MILINSALDVHVINTSPSNFYVSELDYIAKATAIKAKLADGTPTPIPIFSSLVSGPSPSSPSSISSLSIPGAAKKLV